ncbi:AAA family ATPase [Elizabethkingia sp. JS20170427COW]|uniref:AAA family ATPase n=1 Tax=Elizabethkingia sp. JS20170427COW TaxID=2583851 RepID=UPI0011104023|nr:ATP-binding protein [Elizabethkingia sp. JS20170427COW]QCX54311.1 AAA family ATPase [Elizabethkingia sp. JS20170427COW]
MNIVDLLIFEREKVDWKDVVMSEENRKSIDQLLKEFYYLDELKKYNLPVNNKVLLYGHSGCGKTMTAKAIASSLNRALLILDLSSFVSSRIGETAKNIKMVFEKAEREKAVLFLDEFDHIGKMRGNDDQDVGEMRRMVNALIQMIDQCSDRTLLIAATNHPDILDVALLRRFQVKIGYNMPDHSALDLYYDQLLKDFPEDLKHFDRKYDISYAEAKDFALTKMKESLIKTLENNL